MKPVISQRQYEQRLEEAHVQFDLQKQPGTWDADDYNLGVYNGMECILATIEGREPEYRQFGDTHEYAQTEDRINLEAEVVEEEFLTDPDMEDEDPDDQYEDLD